MFFNSDKNPGPGSYNIKEINNKGVVMGLGREVLNYLN